MADGGRQVAAFFGIEAEGHINPLLGFAEALVRHGLEVHFFAPRTMRERVEGAGAVWCHYGAEDWDLFDCAQRVVREQLRQEPDVEGARCTPYAAVPATLGVLPFLIGRMAQLRPAFLVHDAAVPWGLVLGRLLRIPAVCSMTALPQALQARERYADKWLAKENLFAAARALRAAYGLEYNVHYCYTNYQPFTIVWSSKAWHKGHGEFAPGQYHYWGPLVSRRKGLTVPPLPGQGRPLVFVSLGTVVTCGRTKKHVTLIEDFYRKILAVAASMPEAQFLLAIGTNKDFGVEEQSESGCARRTLLGVDVPANTSVERRVDQPSVLELASAFVTHCGQNSSSEAILSGVPVVAVPFMSDQPDNAERFEELGCGIVKSYFRDGATGAQTEEPVAERVTVASLTAAVRKVLAEPSFRSAMDELRRAQAEECSGSMGSKIEALLQFVAASDQGRMFA